MKTFFRRMMALTLCTVLLLLTFAGCADPGEPVHSGDPTPSAQESSTAGTVESLPADTDGIIDIGVDALPYPEEQIYEQLFDLNNKVDVNIDMSPEELQKMQDDYDYYRSIGSKSPIYRMADVTFTITTAEGSTVYRISEVGVRMKGNTSRRDFYNSDEGIYNYIHLKLDFQETFDEEAYYGEDAKVWDSKDLRKVRKNRTFATLEKLEMRWNKCYDSTYLKETYAYELYRSEGVLAPLTNLASFDWSGVHMGIYTINEPVDEVFLEKRLSGEDLGGDLYKCGWTSEGASFTRVHSMGMENEDNSEFYIYDLKTNKKTSQHEALTNLITQLNSGTVTKESFAELVDIDNFLSYAAVSYFLGNPDDLRNNYNNFYIYFLQSSGKAIIIPYDYDRCLGVTVDYNPSGHGMTSDDPFSELREGAQNGPAEQENPLFIWSVDKGGFYVAEYAQVLERVAGNALLEKATFKQYFDRAAALYGSDVQPSKNLWNGSGRDFSFDLYRTSSFDSQGNISFDEYIDAKMAAFQGYMANVDDILDYVRPVPANYFIRGDFNDWSNHDEYGMASENGILTYTLSFNHDFSFKVYDNVNQAWYGVECLAADSELEYTTDDHGNFDLKAGTYDVTFDPETKIITVTKQ